MKDKKNAFSSSDAALAPMHFLLDLSKRHTVFGQGVVTLYSIYDSGRQ